MFNLTRRNPFREMMDMRDEMDRLFERSVFGPRWNWDMDLPLDMIENDDEYVVKASIPGINPDDLEITLQDRLLTIKGEVKGEDETKDKRYHMRERWSGSFTRSISLPTHVKSDAIEASYEAGVLKLHIPKAEEVKARKIAIHTESPKMIEGKIKGKK